MRIYPFKAKHPKFNLIPSPDLFFSTVNYDYSEFDASGFYQTEKRNYIYIYQIEKKETKHLGVLAALDVEDYRSGHVLKHEHTIDSKKQDTIQKTLHREAMIKPILLGYPNRKRLRNLLLKYINSNQPYIETKINKSNEKHRIWIINDPKIEQKLSDSFAQIDHVYIADGHHRSATLNILDKSGQESLQTNHLYCALFPFEDLEIHAYNRIVNYPPKMKMSQLIARLSEYFNIEILEKYNKWPDSKHEIIMLMNYEYYKLTWKSSLLKSEEGMLLDTYLFNQYVLGNIFNIEDVRSDPRMIYVRGTKGPKGVMEQVMKDEYRIGFVLHPLSKRDFVKTAYRGEVLPPKSTWFEPRMRNGMLVMDLKK